jgi:SAM-dependent methyltransferase
MVRLALIEGREMAPTPNESEKRRWNDPYWTSVWPQREALTDSVTADLLTHLAAKPGEQVLDIGSGGGKTALAVGRQVGPTGRVTGIDISEALIALATRRAAEAQCTQVRFVEADAQEDSVPGAPFSAAMSQFGVMFFDEPAKAFANIARHLEPDGRLAFACWQSMDRNPWAVSHAIGSYVPPPPAPEHGKSLAGPFALGDAARTTELLSWAGWGDVQIARYERIVPVERIDVFDDGQLAFNGVAEADLPAARDAVDRHLGRFARPDGRLDVPIAFFVVTAERRGGTDLLARGHPQKLRCNLT